MQVLRSFTNEMIKLHIDAGLTTVSVLMTADAAVELARNLLKEAALLLSEEVERVQAEAKK